MEGCVTNFLFWLQGTKHCYGTTITKDQTRDKKGGIVEIVFSADDQITGYLFSFFVTDCRKGYFVGGFPPRDQPNTTGPLELCNVDADHFEAAQMLLTRVNIIDIVI